MLNSANPAAPLPNSYWLPGTRIAAGEYPATHDDAPASRAKLCSLLDAGVRTFIDLTSPADGLSPYAGLLASEAAARGVRTRHHRLTIPDMGVPPARHMVEILDTIDRTLHDGAVYVHCWGGRGRTGTVVGCHFVRHGMNPDDALALVLQLFESMEKARNGRREDGSPQTDEQRRFVRDWATRELE